MLERFIWIILLVATWTYGKVQANRYKSVYERTDDLLLKTMKACAGTDK